MRLLVLCVIVALPVGAAYLPGLSGGFVFDDFANILENPFVTAADPDWRTVMTAAATGAAGPTGRPLSMVSFALNYAVGGSNPFTYKLFNLIIHLVNTLLVLTLARQLLSTRAAPDPGSANCVLPAALIALAWGLYPGNLSGVLYVVQRMTSLAALFMLAACVLYAHGRLQNLRGRTGVLLPLAGVSVCTLLAVSAKEIGALTPAYLLVIETLCFRFQALRAADARLMKAFFIVTVAAPVAFVSMWLLTGPEGLLARFEQRPFTLVERLLTETRVMWAYLGQMLMPVPEAFSLYHDEVRTSSGLFAPPATVAAIAGLVLSAGLAWRLRGRTLLPAFAVAWFLVSQSLESTFLPLELMQDHRNYLGSFGVLFALLTGLWFGVAHGGLRRTARLAAVGCVALFGLMTFLRAEQWGHPLSLAHAETARAPASARAHYELGRVYHLLYALDAVPALRGHALQHYATADRLDRQLALPLFASMQLALADGTARPDLVARLLASLQQGPVHVAVPAGFDQLVRCASQGRCPAAPDHFLPLFAAALANPSLTDRMRARLLILQGTYQANVLQDPGAAARSITAAVDIHPDNVAHRIALLRLHVVAGDQARAAAERLSIKRLLARNPLLSGYERWLEP